MIYLFALLLLKTHAQEIRQLPVDFTLRNVQLTENMIAFGSQLMPWAEWIKRPSAGPLQVPTEFDKTDLEVFEARSAGIVRKPITQFTAGYLHNIETIRKLDPQNRHRRIVGDRFTIETLVPFPPSWAEMIAIGKKTGMLDDKTTDHLLLTSVFQLRTKSEIESNHDLRAAIQKLDIVGRTPEVVNLQGTLQVNQIANFISVVTLFYSAGPNRTLVVNHMAIAIKRHLLRKGFERGGVKLNGRSVMMGENAVFNTDRGIGAGLPKYAAEFLKGMQVGLER